jgi:hypothetical protein
VQSGAIPLAEINFKLTLPYPESQVNPEIISSQKDLLDLAGSIMDMLKDRVLGDTEGQLPPELVKQVLTQILPYDDDRINKWVQQVTAAKPKEADQPAQEDFTESRKILKEIGGKILKETIDKTIFDSKDFLREGALIGKHFYSSSVLNTDFDVGLLELAQKNKVLKLNEEFANGRKAGEKVGEEKVDDMSLAEDDENITPISLVMDMEEE